MDSVFREQLEEAIKAYDERAHSAGLEHGVINTNRDRFRLAWVGLDADYDQLHDVAAEYGQLAMDDIIDGIPPLNVVAGLWAHGVIVGMLLMQMRQTERVRDGRPDGGGGSGE